MMNRPFRLILSVAMVCSASLAVAGRLPLETLPAGAKWVVQLDVKALSSTPAGQELFATLADPPQESELRKLETALGCDIRQDLTAVAACGFGGAAQGGVFYLRGRWNLPKLSAWLADTHPVATQRHGRHAIMNWSDAGAPKEWEHISVCLVSSNLVLLSNREAALEQGLDVLDGQAPSLATVPRFQRMAAMDTNVFLRAVAVDLKEILADLPAVAMLPAAESLQAVLQSDGQGVRLKGVIRASSKEEALQLQMTLAGIQAVTMWQGGKNPLAATLARSARISINEQDVHVELTASGDTLKRLLTPQKHGAEAPASRPAQP